MKKKIGIGITEHNRPEILRKCLANIKQYSPNDFKIVIVDDASIEPVKGATFRFEKNVGIARAKNKCIELLQDCDHIFLFDSDCWPKVNDWWKPYVEGKEPHYCYIFKDFINMKLHDCVELYRDEDSVAYSHARGCMIYIENKVIDAVGGMDSNYRRWGYEHVDWSNRIYNVGLTKFRYQDVPNSNQLIYSADEHQSVKSTVTAAERAPYLQEMKDYFEKSFSSTRYAPFTEQKVDVPGTEDVVITVFFTGAPDPQRQNMKWNADISQLNALMNSMKGQKLIVLNDCFDSDTPVPEGVELVRVGTNLNPYFQKWLSVWEYLRDHKEVRKVFVTDATDVEMLKNPFDQVLDGKIYVGSETIQTHNNWMIANHRVQFIQVFLRQNAQKILLNCGIVGGSREDVMSLSRKMNQLYYDNQGNVGNFDMGLFNYVARTFFSEKIVIGPHINTKFKAYEINNKEAWWKHK